MGYDIATMTQRIKGELGSGPITDSPEFDLLLGEIVDDAAHEVYMAAAWTVRCVDSTSNSPSNLAEVITAHDSNGRVVTVTTSGPTYNAIKPAADGRTTAVLIKGSEVVSNGSNNATIVYLTDDGAMDTSIWPGDLTKAWYLSALAGGTRLGGDQEKSQNAEAQYGVALERAIKRYDIYYRQFKDVRIGEEEYVLPSGEVKAAMVAARLHAAIVARKTDISRSELTNIAADALTQLWHARPWPFAVSLQSELAAGGALNGRPAANYAYTSSYSIPIVTPEKFGSAPPVEGAPTMAAITHNGDSYRLTVNGTTTDKFSLLVWNNRPGDDDPKPEELLPIWYETALAIVQAAAEGKAIGKDVLQQIWQSFAERLGTAEELSAAPEPKIYSLTSIVTLAQRVRSHMERHGARRVNDRTTLSAVKDAIGTVWNLTEYTFRQQTATINVSAGEDEYTLPSDFDGVHPDVDVLWPLDQNSSGIRFIDERRWAMRQQSDAIGGADEPAVARIAWDKATTKYKLHIRPQPKEDRSFGISYIRKLGYLGDDSSIPVPDDYSEAIYQKALLNAAISCKLERRAVIVLERQWLRVKSQVALRDRPRPARMPEDTTGDLADLASSGLCLE